MPIKTKKIKATKQTEVTSTTIDEAEEDSVEEVEKDTVEYIDPVKYRNNRYRFDPRHPLYETHVQMVRSSIPVPILTGKTPPQIPQGPMWDETKAEQCAQY
jgi:hypothetical protein